MHQHTLKLNPKYYDYILHGTKRIELRLNDEKRRLFNISDTITFYKEPELKESFSAKIIDLLYFDSFNEAIDQLPFELIADKSDNKDALINDLNTFYTSEEQTTYGVVGIKLELLN